MIIQPERGTRNINEKFYEMETRQIAILNEIFGEVELTKGEMRTLVWLAGWEERMIWGRKQQKGKWRQRYWMNI